MAVTVNGLEIDGVFYTSVHHISTAIRPVFETR
jgi:hypothetical protein